VTTPGQLLIAYWRQSLRRSNWWQTHKEDGLDVTLVGNMFALNAYAYTHLCPRCLTQTNRVTGELVICGRCRLRSAPTYRKVRVLVERANESQMVDRLELLALRDLNPIGLPNEQTFIDLTAWERFDKEPEETWPGTQP
jgi:hypothetical protein